MPVERIEDDGRPFRSYRGKPQPLGVLSEWQCPSCGQKVEGRLYEQGCPHCGMGVPGTQPPPPPPRQEIEVEGSNPSVRPGPNVSPTGVGREIASPSLGPSMVVTRVLQYVCKPGYEQALEQTLQHALVGKFRFAWGTITAAIVDDVSPRQHDILTLASRQPGVWLGGPEAAEMGGFDSRWAAPAPKNPRGTGERWVAPAPETIPKRSEESPVTDSIIPDTGPAFSRIEGEMAKVLVQTCGLKLAYTLAIALQTFAAANDDSDPLLLTTTECYALSNAIMQHIPADYVEPELPPPPPPSEGPATPEQEAARARIQKIQAASMPTASFRE